MKQNRSRWIALLLALCLLASALPLIALAEGSIQTKEDYEGAVERVQKALKAEDKPVAQKGQHTVTRTYQVGSIVAKEIEGEITMGGANEFDLPVAGTLTLRAAETAEAYRWQVYVGGVWANIAGETGKSVTLTCAKLQNAISGGEASVRCVLTSNGSEHITPTATVRVNETVETVSTVEEKQIDVTTYYQETLIGRAQRLNSVAVQADPDTYTIRIDYVFADGKQAANPWTATVATGNTFVQDITSPTVVGYAPDQPEVHVETSAAKVYTVTYQPAEVDFTVEHYLQNTTNDKYTLESTETKKGITESQVGENLAKSYTGFYKLLYDGTTKIAADGSTVVQVYYDRSYYLMNFDLDGGYGVDPIYARFGTSIGEVKTPTKAGYTFVGWAETKDGAKIDSLPATMPAEHKTYYAIWEGTDKAKVTIVIWGENADDEEYSYYKNAEVMAETGSTLKYTDLQGKENESFDGAKFYYTRNSYTLSFYNYNAELTDKAQTVKYEAPLKNYNFTPSYPANLEPKAYKFAGWYTTEKCLDGTEVDWDNMTMPASKLILYAKWVPVTHTVKFYLTEDDGKTDNVYNPGGEDGIASFMEPHGGNIAKKYVDSHLTKEAMLEANPRKPYKFVVWYYYEDDANKTGKKYFDPTMQIRQDMKLYAEWGSDVLVPYTIRYAVENAEGTLTYIAKDTTGSALAGSTKTFDAKTGTQLNEGYQSGYFPKESSHSITMDIEGNAENGKNKFTFIYVAKPEVEYTVKYLEKGTGNVLAEPKTVTTRDAVVTETFKQIKGYAPDAYQKQMVLAAEGNEIIFWYVKDDAHAPVQIIHWTQNIAGDGYTRYQESSNLNGVIGNDYSETPLDIQGFTYNANPEHPVDGYPARASGELTAAGLVLNLYYDRIEYPYEFRFLEQGTEKVLADPVTGNARYQAQVTRAAKDIPGYTLVSAANQAINIDIEDPANVASKNVKTFYYTEQTVEIKYVVVGPTGCGTLDNYQESQLKVTTGEVKGSTPIVADGYTFVGWYTDEACTVPVNSDWVDNNNSKLTPDKTAKIGGTEEAPIMAYEGATYYAKFEAAVGSLTITKQGCNEALDEDQSFVFVVTNLTTFEAVTVTIKGNKSVTINDLPAGEYKVWEDKYWSWRYTPDGTNGQKTVKVEGGKNTKVPFNNTRTNGKWLDGNAYKSNKWSN